MTNDKGILIKNIFYMLAYAFQVLEQSNYASIAAEEFEEIEDLFAAILAKGAAQQLKQGLHRDYIGQHESLSVMRGKLDMPETIQNRIRHKQKITCEFDELSENIVLNQILKTTIYYLLHNKNVQADRKKDLKRVIAFLDGIDLLEPSAIP